MGRYNDELRRAIQVRSKAEAVEWAKRIPFSTEVHPGEHVEVEIRQIMEIGVTTES